MFTTLRMFEIVKKVKKKIKKQIEMICSLKLKEENLKMRKPQTLERDFKSIKSIQRNSFQRKNLIFLVKMD